MKEMQCYAGTTPSIHRLEIVEGNKIILTLY